MTDEQIIQEVLTYAKKEDLLGNSRYRAKVYRRQYLYAYLRSHGFTLEEIGSLFNRHHATVHFGLKQYELFKSDHHWIDFTREARRLFALTDKKKRRIDFGLVKLELSELGKLDSFMFDKGIETYPEAVTELLKLI